MIASAANFLPRLSVAPERSMIEYTCATFGERNIIMQLCERSLELCQLLINIKEKSLTRLAVYIIHSLDQMTDIWFVIICTYNTFDTQ